jgi:hypothetical protein
MDHQADRIRPLRRDDVPQVASLYEFVFRSGVRTPPPRLVSYFERTLLDHPWVDPEIPSLVYVDQHGRVAGFIGSHVRRLTLEGKPVRMACSAQLMSDPIVRSHCVGTMLLRRFLAGPQDLTVTDRATDPTRRVWTTFGGSINHLGSISWLRPVHWRSLGELSLEHVGMPVLRPVVAPALSVVQAIANRIPRLSLRVESPATLSEELTPEAVLEHLPIISEHVRLRPDYDKQYLGWLFQEMAAVKSRGQLAKRLVRDRKGRVLGWYVTYLQQHGLSRVMQIAARERDAQAVLDHLLHDAQESEVAVLVGQYDPTLMEPLRQTGRRYFIHLSGNFLVHSRSPEVLDPILQGQAMLTRMEGEAWMGHRLEAFS